MGQLRATGFLSGLAGAAIILSSWTSGLARAQDSPGGTRVHIIDKAPDGRPFFEGPVSIRCHPDGRLFIVDDLAHRVHVFTRSGELARSLGTHGLEPGQLAWPDAIHWDASGLLFVADTGTNRIQVWDADGRSVRELGRPPRWQRALGSLLGGLVFGGLRSPRDVLIGPDGLVYVSDTGNDLVQVFDRDGTLVRSIGESQGSNGAVRQPLGLAVSNNQLFIADNGNHRVQVFSPNGAFVKSLGRRGTKPGELDSPHGLAVDSRGLLYVADRGNKRVQVWTQDGAVVRIIGPELNGLATPITPAGLCVTNDGALAVVDLAGHRVLITDE